eukprot:2000100-Rhodomonas_salina.1
MVARSLVRNGAVRAHTRLVRIKAGNSRATRRDQKRMISILPVLSNDSTVMPVMSRPESEKNSEIHSHAWRRSVNPRWYNKTMTMPRPRNPSKFCK